MHKNTSITKKTKLTSMRAFLVFFGMLFMLNTYAYDFEKDGIYYNIVSMQDKTLQVTYPEKGYTCENLIVPDVVNYAGHDFTVVSMFFESDMQAGTKITNIRIPKTVKSFRGYPCTFENVYIEDIESYLNITLETAYYPVESRITSDITKIYVNDLLLTNLTVPGSISKIGKYAFHSYKYLESVEFEDGVEEIGQLAFCLCANLKTVRIPNSMKYLWGRTFLNSGVENLFIDKNADICLNDRDFCGTKIKELHLYSNCYIGDQCFADCKELTSLVIDDTDKTNEYWIGSTAFKGCEKLNTVNLPESTSGIGYESFYGCSKLKSIYCKASTPPSVGSSAFGTVNMPECSLFVPKESITQYKESTEVWCLFNIQEYQDISGINNVPSVNRKSDSRYSISGLRIKNNFNGIYIEGDKKYIAK